jgi:hypothetical protein
MLTHFAPSILSQISTSRGLIHIGSVAAKYGL